jgi:hypothetical protein
MVTSRDGQEIATYFVDYGPLSHTAYVGLRNWVKFVCHTTEPAIHRGSYIRNCSVNTQEVN